MNLGGNKGGEEIMGNKILKKGVTFPELRALMAKYGVTYTEIGKIIGNTYQTVSKKFNESYEFGLVDMYKIKEYFINLGESPEDIKIDKLFFDWKFTNVNKSA